MLMQRLAVVLGLQLLYVVTTQGEFLVNVKTEAGNIVRQSITENIRDSYIRLEYDDWDLTRVTQLVDFKSHFNVFRVILYGEIELGQPVAQILCFVSHFADTDFIDPDAVSKLRQKNQDAIRTSENQLDNIFAAADLMVDPEESHLLSPHIKALCEKSNGAIYTTESDISKTAKDYGRDYETMMSATRRLPAISLPECNVTNMSLEKCACSYQINIDWYPCSLRYCKGVVSNRPSTYKCGIKTCSVARIYHFPMENKSKCWWNQSSST